MLEHLTKGGFWIYQIIDGGFGIVKADTEEEARSLAASAYSADGSYDPVDDVDVHRISQEGLLATSPNVLELGWSMVLNIGLYNAITDFADRFGGVKWNDDECVAAYKNLVDLCITAGKIPECNRKEPSTHGCLQAAISYEDNRQRFCEVTI